MHSSVAAPDPAFLPEPEPKFEKPEPGAGAALRGAAPAPICKMSKGNKKTRIQKMTT